MKVASIIPFTILLLAGCQSTFQGVNPAENGVIHKAANAADLEAVRDFLKNGVDVNSKYFLPGEKPPTHNLGTPLLFAVEGGNIQIVELLLEKGADVNAKNIVQVTPLLSGVDLNNYGIVKLLISHGADLNAQTETGTSPLHNAAIYGRNRILKLLVEHGANVNIRARYGKTPLDEAIKYMQTAVAPREILCEN